MKPCCWFPVLIGILFYWGVSISTGSATAKPLHGGTLLRLVRAAQLFFTLTLFNVACNFGALVNCSTKYSHFQATLLSTSPSCLSLASLCHAIRFAVALIGIPSLSLGRYTSMVQLSISPQCIYLRYLRCYIQRTYLLSIYHEPPMYDNACLISGRDACSSS